MPRLTCDNTGCRMTYLWSVTSARPSSHHSDADITAGSEEEIFTNNQHRVFVFRVCGQVFCSKCCSSYIPGECQSSLLRTVKRCSLSGKHIVPGHTGTIRVCTSCLGSYQASDQAGVPAAPVTGQETHDDTAAGTSSPVQYRRRPSIDQVAASSSSPGAYISYRKVSSTVPLYTREQSELSGSDSVTGDTNQTEEIIKLRDPHNLNRLWARIMDPELGVKLETPVRARQWP